MAQKTSPTDAAFEARRSVADEDEPLLTVDRKLQPDGKTPTPTCNLSTYAKDIVGLEVGMNADVHIFRNRIVITPPTEGDNEF